MDYLLRPSENLHDSRPGTAVAILVIYSLLLFMILATYFRILQTVITNPGYVPFNANHHANKSRGSSRQRWKDKRSSRPNSHDEKAAVDCASHAQEDGLSTGPRTAGLQLNRGNEAEARMVGLEQFYARDVFVCEGDGRPRWCSTCLGYKPDRAHHCREVGRCVRKMDHFCPWLVQFC